MLYRSKEEVEEHRKQDGLPRYKQYLIDCGLWSEEQDAELHKQLQQHINEATKYAEEAPYPLPEDTYTHVFAEEGQ